MTSWITAAETPPELAHLPHHDGSELYVTPQVPTPGGSVHLRLRVPPHTTLGQVGVRHVVDGEPQWTPASVDHTDADGVTWWGADITLHNPLTHYRWLLRGGSIDYAWLNASGLHHRDVTDAEDFRLSTFARAPEWARDAVVYQVFPDRFARSADADNREVPEWAVAKQWDDPIDLDWATMGAQLWGGDLDGIREHLDHIESLGITVLYLTPIFPARSNHRYDASTFDRVDPLLGGDEALQRLVAACHERGIRVMGDITTNHTGDAHEWFQRAQADPDAPERDFYYFDDSDTGYVGWLGVPSLPKLHHASPLLRRRFFDDDDAPVKRWLRPPFDLDAWRVDVGNMTGRHGSEDRYHEVARTVRAAAEEVRPDVWVVAEHCHDLLGEVDGDGWHGAMNYSGFTRPAWTWLRSNDFAPAFLGQSLGLPRLPGDAVVAAMRSFNAGIPWSSLVGSFDLIGSHDTTRLATIVGNDDDVLTAAVGLMFTMPGVPMVCYGDEVGLEGEFGEDGRRPMPWGHPDRWNQTALTAYRDLARLRREHRALTHGGLRWLHVDVDLLVFARESADQTALVAVARTGCGPVELPLDAIAGAAAGRLVLGQGISVDATGIHARFDTAGVAVWVVDRSA